MPNHSTVPRGRWLLAALACAAFAGCIQIGYVVQAGLGQLRLWGKARPIDAVLADLDVGPRTKWLLGQVGDILDFARRNGLDTQGNYEKYVELDRGAVVWFMGTSRPLAFEPKVWSFPIVGSFTYLGWFDVREAQQIRAYLEGDGWDVHLRPVRAYSTGGWFRDPVLSSMLSPRDDALRSLVNVLLHELTHANILIADQSTFNESVASFVGDTLAQQYLGRRFGADSPEVAAFRDEEAEWDRRGARLAKAYQELSALYDGPATQDEKLANKKRILRALRDDLDLWYEPNNASLFGFKTYNAGLPEFAALYDACARSWPRFFAAVAGLTPDSFAQEQLEEIGPVIAGLTAAGCPEKPRAAGLASPPDEVSRRVVEPASRRAREQVHQTVGALSHGLPARRASPIQAFDF